MTLMADLPRLKVATRCLVEFNTLYLVYNNNFLILSCYTVLCHFLCSKYRVPAYYLYICLFIISKKSGMRDVQCVRVSLVQSNVIC